MSIRRMTAVWEQSAHKGNELLLLLALADNANDDGYCWPSIDTLAGKTRLSRSTVIRLCEKVEESGELFISHSRRHGNKYLVIVGMQLVQVATSLKTYFKLNEVAISAKLQLIENRQQSYSSKPSKSQNDTSEVSSCDTSEVALMLHESSIEPSIETNIASPKSEASTPVLEEVKPDTPHIAMCKAICAAFGYDWDTVTKSKRGKVIAASSELREAGVTPEDVLGVYQYCQKKLETFGPNALASQWDDYKATRPVKLVDYSQGDPLFDTDFANLSPIEAADLALKKQLALLERLEKAG
jgi:hypothetical protein